MRNAEQRLAGRSMEPSEGGKRNAKPEASWSIERAKRVQMAMLPKAPSIPGLDIYTHYQPCEHVSGDFFDFVPVSPYHLGFVIGDVAGHGFDAALIMAAAKK